MNNYNNNSTCDALSSPKANMGSGQDMGMYHRDGVEEPGHPAYLRKNSNTVQKQPNTLSNGLRWRSDSNIKRNRIRAGRNLFLILGELLSEEVKKKEEKEEETEEKNEAKGEEKSEERKEEKNESKKGKKKRKKGKRKMEKVCMGTKSMEIRAHESRDIFTATPGPASKLDVHTRTSQPLQKTSNDGKCVLDDKSQKNNSSLLRSISYSSEIKRQSSLDCDSNGQRFTSIPTRSKLTDKSEDRELGLWQLRGNNSLDLPSQQVRARYSNKNVHNQCAIEKKGIALPELRNLPGYICEQLDKNNHLEFHQITEKEQNSLDFLDAEFTEYLDENYGIGRYIQPVFVDHSGLVIWFLDKNDNMFEWDEMQQSLKYIGKDLIDGLTNYFIYPENVCVVLEDTGERIPVKEFNHLMEERLKRIMLKNTC